MSGKKLGKLKRPGRRASWPPCRGLVIRGRLFSQADLATVRRLIRRHPSWGRTRLSQEACKAFDWHQANGRTKERACRVALLRLESLGYLRLPPRLIDRGGRAPKVPSELPEGTCPDSVTAMPSAIDIRLVRTRPEARTWNAVVGAFHYLSLATPVGKLIRYLIYGDSQLVAAISFSECAWNVGPRNNVLGRLGFDCEAIRNSVICNNRFLILPSVSVPNLASRILSLSIRRVRADWEERFRRTPLVVETFVDPTRFAGTCYFASNWICIGRTRGYAKRGDRHVSQHAPKLLMVRALVPSLQKRLLSELRDGTRRAA